MSEKFKDIYRIPSARATWWDYSHKGLYFVTICTYRMDRCLGHIRNKEMHLSDIGKIAEIFWTEIPEHFPFVKLHAWTIMPNHVHGIIEILADERAEIWQPFPLPKGRWVLSSDHTNAPFQNKRIYPIHNLNGMSASTIVSSRIFHPINVSKPISEIMYAIGRMIF
ncbi:MAG: hypothetical protein M0Q53_07785 [Prolixibacteraceae bacterium]|jgi:REP element-mobilizing transposase RayT|nr:hypothetical protein [Prolixibacteraceae bacterium]